MQAPRKPHETLEALADIEREMVAELNPDELLRMMVARAKRLFGGECGILLAEGGWLVSRIDTDPAVTAHRVAIGTGVLGRCAETRSGALVNDYPSRPEAIPWAVALGLKHVIAEPLLLRDELMGVIVVNRRGQTTPPFLQEDAEALKRFAGLAAFALRNATLHEDAERRRRDAEILARLAADLNRSLDLDTVLERVVAGARDLCASDFAAVALRDGDAGPMTIRFGPGARLDWRGKTVRPGHGAGGFVLLSGKPFTTRDIQADPRVTLEPSALAATEGIVALAVVPIRREEDIRGLLYACNHSSRPFSDDDVRKLCHLADHAAIAIHNAQLYAERVNALSALSESDQRYRLLAENMVDVVGLFDMRMRPVYVSPSVIRLRGYTAQEAMAQTAEERFTPASMTVVLDALREELAVEASGQGDPGRSRTIELELLCKDGSTVWTETTTSFVRDERGTAVGIVTVARNIDERKRAEATLREREAQLLQAQKMEAVGRLAGGIAHDFNNILTVIGGRAQLLLHTLEASAPGRHAVELIQQAAERAGNLTRQLLAFSRKQMLQPSVLDLTAVVTGLMPMLRHLIGEHIQLTVVPGATGSVRADATQVEQVIANLAINAQDAMPDGGRLTIETADVDLGAAFTLAHPGARPGRHVMLSVTDTGHGIDPDTRAKVFEPFFTTKEPGRGTGLGLSTVYGIIKQHDGYVAVESELGHGSTFTVYFPRVEAPPDATEPLTASVPSPHRSERILLVEDEPAVRAVAQESLAAKGYAVLEAQDVDDALRIAREDTQPIDLLVTDVVMPVMNGRQLAERIQALHPEAQVLYMSGYIDDAIVHHGVLEGGTAFLQKPFTPADLARRVREMLDAEADRRRAGFRA